MRNRRTQLLAVALALSACDNSGIGNGQPDLAAPADLSAPADATPAPDLAFAPAPHPPLPQLVDHGGGVLANVQLVTITWPEHPLAKDLVAFDAWLPQSSWWKLLGEYGVGPGKQAATYSVGTAPPSTMTETDLRALLEAGFSSGALPKPAGGTLYDVYLPEATTFERKFGQTTYKSCVSFYSYHSSLVTSAGVAAFALHPFCPNAGGQDPLDFLTLTASAEIASAATNPTYKGWFLDGFGADTVTGTEVPGQCYSFSVVVDGRTVAALYSNKAAAADQRPCLPAPAGPMYRAWADPDEVDLVKGQTVTARVKVYSTAPLAKALKLTVYSYPQGSLKTAIPVSLVKNGDDHPLTVEFGPNATPGDTAIILLRVDGTDYHYDSYLLVHTH